MTVHLPIEEFSGHVGERFDVAVDGQLFPITLAEANPLGGASLREGGSFLLIFTGPRTPILRQGLYELSCGEGRWQIFLVPTGDCEGLFRYEAVFN